MLQIKRDDLVKLVIVDQEGQLVAGDIGPARAINAENRSLSFGAYSSKEIIQSIIRKPLKNLMMKMKLVKQGFLDIPMVLERKDKFGELSIHLDRMLRQIVELMQNAQQDRLLKRDLEIQVLQSQINPHFLYNTLS